MAPPEQTHADLQREHPDPLAARWAPLLLDRQRVIHSAAFRRLQHKTQAFLSLESDHYRTRLTHTLEVAHLARLIAARLELDQDLAEVVALAHDLGHPPFGHAGERALAACMRDHGGFEHNAHALRVVEYLEHPYPRFRGLNLTRIVRECLAKHSTAFDRPAGHPLRDGRRAPLEGQVVDLADRLAYALHDLQDGLYAGLIEPAALESLDLWVEARRRADDASHAPPPAPADPHAWRGTLRPVIDHVRDALLDDAVDESRRRAARLGLRCADDARRASEAGIALSTAGGERLAELERFLARCVYGHGRLAQRDARAQRVLTELFDACVSRPELLPPRFARRVPEQGAHRVVADYLAGMTDRFALRAHARHCGPSARQRPRPDAAPPDPPHYNP